MKQSLLRHDEGVVVSALPEWTGRLAEALGRPESESSDRLSSVICCSNVYETTAAVVELRQREHQVLAGIMVDYLPAGEMRVFETLAGMDRVRTVAISALGRWEKLARAQELGADEVLSLGAGRATVKVEPRVAEAVQRAPASTVGGEPVKFRHIQRPIGSAGSAENSLVDLAAKAIESARISQNEAKSEKTESHQATPISVPKEQPAEPLISDEEREALLG
jgi:hypothetical protein